MPRLMPRLKPNKQVLWTAKILPRNAQPTPNGGIWAWIFFTLMASAGFLTNVPQLKVGLLFSVLFFPSCLVALRPRWNLLALRWIAWGAVMAALLALSPWDTDDLVTMLMTAVITFPPCLRLLEWLDDYLPQWPKNRTLIATNRRLILSPWRSLPWGKVLAIVPKGDQLYLRSTGRGAMIGPLEDPASIHKKIEALIPNDQPARQFPERR